MAVDERELHELRDRIGTIVRSAQAAGVKLDERAPDYSICHALHERVQLVKSWHKLMAEIARLDPSWFEDTMGEPDPEDPQFQEQYDPWEGLRLIRQELGRRKEISEHMIELAGSLAVQTQRADQWKAKSLMQTETIGNLKAERDGAVHASRLFEKELDAVRDVAADRKTSFAGGVPAVVQRCIRGFEGRIRTQKANLQYGRKAEDALEKALRDLVERVELVTNHPKFVGVFHLAQNHFGQYKGPTLGKELEAAKKFLDDACPQSSYEPEPVSCSHKGGMP